MGAWGHLIQPGPGSHSPLLSLPELRVAGSVKGGGRPGSQACVWCTLVFTNLATAICLLSRKHHLCVQAVQPAVSAQGQQH